MRLSVLIVSYNVEPLLERCLASLGEADEVVVVDNGSKDGSAAMVRERFPNCRLLALSDNRGFAVGVNLAAREAKGELLLLLNPDAELSPGNVAAMAQELDLRPEAAALGFRQIDEAGRFQLAVGPAPWLSLELARLVLQRRLDRGDRLLGRALDRALSRPMRVPWVAGSCLLVRRGAFEAVGGFDERFFLFFEDIDFCLRLASSCGPVFYVPTVTVRHHRGASAAKDERRAARAYRHSQIWFWRKHRGVLVASAVKLYQRLRGVAP
ncbi:MAG: glycosyltransferase family 2 protein [Deltaproteobacteria bacterium]|nr:glycosyltransferase family 2 protein [Deltaproteobacteria bacterium]